MIEKKCKECGKIFMAKSARQVYCDGDHYRPCPVCGKPVLIKYLSDPTPKCTECRKNKTAQPKEEITSSALAQVEQKPKQEAKPIHKKKSSKPEGIWMYIGNPYKNGFVPGHEYEIYVERVDSVYEVSSNRDVTDDKEVDIMIPFSSRISIDRNFSKATSY